MTNGGKSLAVETEPPSDTLMLNEAPTYPPLTELKNGDPPKAVQGPSGWVYHSTSLGCLRPHHCIRSLAIHVIESSVFDPFIMITIICNCTTMAWTSPLDPPGTSKAEFLAYMEWVYLYIFTFELVMKVIAYGLLCHPHSYLRDAWCQLDFVVVGLAWLPLLFPTMGSMNALRSVRALRPLRALKRVPGMPVLVGSILQSLPPLINVASVTGFFFIVFGIIGTELFGGVLHSRCADPEILKLGARRLTGLSGRMLKGGNDGDDGSTPHSDPEAEFDTGTFCHVDPNVCIAEGTTCYYFQSNPEGNTVSFDSVGGAFMPLLQAVTFDTWTDPMFDVMGAYNFWAWPYFIIVAIIGGMFVVNLFLAVIFDEFMRAQESASAEKEVSAGVKADEIPQPDGGHQADVEVALIATTAERSDHLSGVAQLSSSSTHNEGGGCCDCTPQHGYRARLRDIMLSACLNNISTGFVIFNLFVMCLPYAGQPAAWEATVEFLGEFVTWVFIIEMFFKLIGLGCAGYWSDGWNLLDGIIVSLSIGEMLITVLLADTGINISFLRMLRLLRLLRLLKAWPGLYKIVMAFVKSIPQISNLFVLMFLVMTIFALLGMQTFGGTGMSEDSRWHFDYYYSAMLAVFGIFTGGWVDAFQACSEASGVGVAVAFFVPCLLIGFFVVMNMFVSILLESFAEEEEEEEEEEGDVDDGQPSSPPDLHMHTRLATELPPLEGLSLGCLPPSSCLRYVCQRIVTHAVFDSFIIVIIVGSSICLALDVPRLDPESELKAKLDYLNYWMTGIFIAEMVMKVVAYGFISTGESAYLKDPWNVLDFNIVLISILGLLADVIPAFGRLKALRILRVLRPLRLLQRDPGMKIIIGSLIKTMPAVVDVSAVVLVFHVVFAILGMMLFMGKFGACTDETIMTRAECVPPALRSRYLAAHVGPLDPPSQLGNLTGMYQPPLLLPLSSEPPAPQMLLPSAAPKESAASHFTPSQSSGSPDSAVNALSTGKLPIDGVSVVMDGDLRLFKHRGVVQGRALNVRRKQMSSRSTRRVRAIMQQQKRQNPRGRVLKGGGSGGDNDSDDLPVEWLNPAFGSFDDFGQAMLILYVASTGDGWEEFMWAGMDATEVDVAPKRNDSSAMSAFFLAWMIVGAFVALNLFVGAIVDNFTRIKAETEGSATMTPEQQQWMMVMKAESSSSPDRGTREPKWKPRRAAFRLITSQSFEFGVMGVIALNVLGMSLKYNRIEDNASYFFYYHHAMELFTYFYYAEALLKIFAMGFEYFRDGWCQFDFFLVCMAFLDQFFLELLMQYLPVPPTVLRLLRVARVLRILRLLKNLKGLRDLLMTLVFAFPALINVGTLLGLVIFIYAVLGMNLFTYVAHGGDLNEHRNFETFGSACLLLFQCLTGDGWSAIMDDCMIDQERGCDPNALPSDCGSPLALPFFISYTVIGSFVFLNLVVAVILDNFTALGNTNPDLVSAADIADFKDTWTHYDPEADGKIWATDLPSLILELPAPLGIANTTDAHGGNPRKQALRFCLTLKLTQSDGKVAFKAVLDALIAKNYASKKVVVALEHPDSPDGAAIDPGSPGSPDGPLSAAQRALASLFAEDLIGRYVARRRASSPDGTISFRHSHPPNRRRKKKGAPGSAMKGVVRAAQKKRPRQSPRQVKEPPVPASDKIVATSTPALPRPHTMPPPGSNRSGRHASSPTFPSRSELSERASKASSVPPSAMSHTRRLNRSGPLSCILWLVWMVLVAASAFLLGSAVNRSLEKYDAQWYWLAGGICALLALFLAPNTLGNALAHAALRVAVTSPQSTTAAGSPAMPPPDAYAGHQGGMSRTSYDEQAVSHEQLLSPQGSALVESGSPSQSTVNGSPGRRKPLRPALALDRVRGTPTISPSNRSLTPSNRASNRSRLPSWRPSSTSRSRLSFSSDSEPGVTALFNSSEVDGPGSSDAHELLFGVVLHARRKRERNEISDTEHTSVLRDMRRVFVPTPLQSQRSQRSQRNGDSISPAQV